MDAKGLLGRGYFPDNLPLAFSSASFAAVHASLSQADGKHLQKEWTEACTVNLARPGGLRRRLSIVNPFKQRFLSIACAREWATLSAQLAKSEITVTRPVSSDSNASGQRGIRYLHYELPRGDWAASRSAILGGTRFTLQADISNFYGSIYTHAIDWALNTKAVAKTNIGGRFKSLGAELDELVRNGQDGQTKGIPVGPDTSHLLAEVLLSELDYQLQARHPAVASRGIRYVDDFDFAARSYSEAEGILHTWDSILSSFELNLNPLKTRIVEGALPPEPTWKIQLRQQALREETEVKLANDLRSLFSLAIAASAAVPGTPALSYAVRMVSDVPAVGQAWTELQNLVLGAITMEPSSLVHVYRLIAGAAWRGQTADRTRFSDVLNEFCAHHAPLEHGSEVTWALYIIHRLGLKVDSETAKAILEMKDNCSIILLRDLDSKKQIEGSPLDWTGPIRRAEDPLAPKRSDWLLAYEFARQGWASDASFRGLAHWNELLEAQVAFYESPPMLQAARRGTSVGSRGGATKSHSEERAEPSEKGTEESGTKTANTPIRDSPDHVEGADEEAAYDVDGSDEEDDLDEIEFMSFRGSDRY